MGIEQFISSSEHKESKVEQFKKLSAGKTKEEVRKLEQQLLKPTVLPPFAKSKTAKTDLEGRTVVLVFPDNLTFDLFSKHFNVLKAGGNNISNMNLLLSLLQELESGRIKYESSENRIIYSNSRNSRRI